MCEGKGKRWVMAVYFTREPVEFKEIEAKFKDDAKGIAKNGAQGIVFFTNNKLTLSEREVLSSSVVGSGHEADIYHRERIRLLLDDPRGYGTRFRFLGIPMSESEQASFFEVADRTWGKDYTDSVLHELLASLFHNTKDVQALLAQVPTHKPYQGEAYVECHGYLKKCLGDYASKLINQLRYSPEDARSIFTQAVLQMFDERHHLTLARLLFTGT